MGVVNSTGDVAEEVRRDEEDVEDPASSIQADESELVSQANALRHVICQGEPEE